MTTTNTEAPTADAYDSAYYGWGRFPVANYRRYGPATQPHWSKPLAAWLSRYAPPPYLDVGCAFGHLVRDLDALLTRHRDRTPELWAQGVEWSWFAVDNSAAPALVTALDARRLAEHYAPATFGTIISLDFLEHFEPYETVAILAQMAALLRPGGLMVHLVGCPDGDPDGHYRDPTHRNHEPLAWYVEQVQALGLVLEERHRASLAGHPELARGGWDRRWLVCRKPANGAQ